MLIELCYKSLANTMTRKNFEAEVNQRLLDKNVNKSLSSN